MRNISCKYSFRIIREILKMHPPPYMRNNAITMNNSGGEREKNRKCTWQEEGTHHPSVSSLRSSNYKGRASFLPIRRRKCRRSEWKSRCFNVYVSPFFSLVLIASLAPPPSLSPATGSR